jgi:hypothetical protein
VNIHVPAIAPRYRITDTMWQDFVWNPTLAAKVLLGFQLDAFQSIRLKHYWLTLQCIDSSGTSSGKTVVLWIWAQLRCLLLPERTVGIFYPTFQVGKGSFWPYYKKCKSPIFHAHLGQIDERGDEDGTGRVHGAACYTAHYKSGAKLDMPAPSMQRDADTQASTRYQDGLIEEYTRVEDMGDAIDAQLKGRISEPTFNKEHPLWGNHIIYSGHARTQMHKSFRRWKAHQRRADRGSFHYANISFSHKDYSNLPCHTGKSFKAQNRADSTIESEKLTTSKSEWMGKGLGLWAVSGDGWFTEEALLACTKAGRRHNILPVLGRKELELPT